MYLFSSGSGYPVMFIHGMPTCSSLWRGVIDRLSNHFTCFAVDLPGHGRTPRIPYGPKQLELLADQIEELRVKNKIEKWHVVGHDAGSAVAVHYAYRYQERVDHLVLLSPALFPELRPFPLFRLLRIPFVGELLAPIVNATFWRIAMGMAGEKREPELKDAICDFQAPFGGLFGAWRLMSVLRFGEPADVLSAIPDMLPGLQIPTLIFQGEHDRAIPRGFAQRASALIPRSKVVMVDAGHFIPLSNPETVADELLDFFEVSGFERSTNVGELAGVSIYNPA
jgi:pimeloyl-ACP methyl ester carboxylesterase